MTCEELHEHLADLVAGESLGGHEAAARAHLAHCALCAARVAALRDAERAVRGTAPAWREAERVAPAWHDVERTAPLRGAALRSANRAAAVVGEAAADFDTHRVRVGRAGAPGRQQARVLWARGLARAAAVVLIAAGLQALWSAAGSGSHAPVSPPTAGGAVARAGASWSVMLSRRAIDTLRSSDDLETTVRAPLAAAARRFPDSPTLSWSLLALAKR
ncbi:MAG: hypothetical protein AB7Q17_10045 [Phycisphaerae bacterium]